MELIRAANQMRIDSEPIGAVERSRILSDYSASQNERDLREALSAVPPDQAWATFQWLDEHRKEALLRRVGLEKLESIYGSFHLVSHHQSYLRLSAMRDRT